MTLFRARKISVDNSGAAGFSGIYTTHDYGMVGFIKELIDECGAADITHPEFGTPPQRASRIREMRLSPSHLFIVKA